ncbi:MAG: Flp pilus assembly protein CpaB [Verrucomicrobiae bacterium]|nr:Flp pilus assembly protein CpaB [Verrucomicrobiae bacterium]
MKSKLILALSIVSGIFAMFLMQYYINAYKRKINQQYQMVAIIAAGENLPVGTTLTRDKLGQKDVSKFSVSARNLMLDQVNLIVGRKLRNSVTRGTPLLWSDIVGDESKGGNLAAMVNEGERAVSIPVDMVSSVTGHVEPNDHVDILGTFTFPSTKGDPQLDTVTLTILQNVTVLATGKETARSLMEGVLALGTSARRSANYSTVTLLVTPREAEMLVFALQKGRLSLTLRNAGDVSSARELGNINFNYLEKKVGEFNDQRQERLRAGGSRDASTP